MNTKILAVTRSINNSSPSALIFANKEFLGNKNKINIVFYWWLSVSY